MEKFGVERFLRRAGWLDHVGQSLQNSINAAFEDTGPTGLQVRNFLNGTWLGHPLHAALSDAPIGLWTGATIFDLLSLVTRDRRLAHAATWCVGLGIGAAAITAAAGMADYSKIEDPQREEATLHALVNTAAVSSYVMSLVRRNQGNRVAGIALGLLGYSLVSFGGDIGGHLVYNLGTLVSRQAWQSPPKEFTPVLSASDLKTGEMRRAEANGYKVLLARLDGHVYAIGDTCNHWGCSLAGGTLHGDMVTCPCHGSQFSLRDGSVIQGPASEPDTAFEVRERNGQIEVRLSPNSILA